MRSGFERAEGLTAQSSGLQPCVSGRCDSRSVRSPANIESKPAADLSGRDGELGMNPGLKAWSLCDGAFSPTRVWALFFSLFLSVVVVSAHANHRVALVIGNSHYPGKDAIPTVAQDAETVAKLLLDRNFRVTTALNRTRDELRILIQAFIDSTPINGTASDLF